MVLKSCKEASCYDPWRSLHPNGDVDSLADALNTKYDTFYNNQTKVEFERCARGYIVDAEGPQDFNVFDPEDTGDLRMRRLAYDADWSLRI